MTKTFKDLVHERMARGEATWGFWSFLPDPLSAEFMAKSGAQYVAVDFQHGLIGFSAGISMMQAINAGGSNAIVRVAWNNPESIMQALDAGATAVVVPMVNNAQEARDAVSACKYPPVGIRSYGPVRAARVLPGNSLADLQSPMLLVMIETASALENLDEILAVDGVDGVYVGPSDLAISLGLEPDVFPHGDYYRDILVSIADACRRYSLPSGIQAVDGKIALDYEGYGYDIITITSDVGILTSGVSRELSIALKKSAGSDDAHEMY